MIKFLHLIFLSILKNFNLKKINYNCSDEIDFGSEEANIFFKKSLLNSKFFLEFGSGNSTILADKLNIDFISIESDKHFFNFLLNKIKEPSRLIYKSLGLTGDYSTPILFKVRKYFLRSSAEKYSGDIYKDLKFLRKFPDLVLIDGRYRVLCALKLHLFLRNSSKKIPIIILDDYDSREHYKIIEKYYEIRKLGRMAILEKLIENRSEKLIQIYNLDCR